MSVHPPRYLPHLLGLCLLAMGCAGRAQAQTVDYNSLETLFGEPVTVGATGKPQKASDVPVGLEIVTADQIRRMGVTSLPEVIERLPGVSNWRANRSFDSVGLRGQNSPANSTLLVLVNGRQVYVDTFGYTDWYLIPVELEEVRQIEVIKGPASALYGFNALTGVINIITVNPKYDALNEAGASVGTGDYRRAHGITTLKLSDDASVRVSAGTESFDEFKRQSKTDFTDFSGTFPNGDGRKFLADGLVQLNDQTQLRVETSYAQMDGVDNFDVYAAQQNSKSFLSGKASLSSETSLGLIEMNLYENHFEGQGITTPDYNTTRVAQLQDLFKLSAEDTVRLSGEYRQNALESDALIGPGAKLSYDVMSAGGVWNHAFTSDLEWTNAVRLDRLMLSRNGDLPSYAFAKDNDYYDRKLLEYSYNSGVVWKATAEDTFRIETGRGIQAPALVSLGANLPLSDYLFYTGNPHLATTTMTNYEVGYDRALPAIGGKFRSTLFYDETRELDTAIYPGAGEFDSFRTIGNSDTAGIELGLKGAFGSSWTWDGSYTYQNAADNLIPGAESYPSATPLHYHDTVPHHVVKAHLGYSSGPWEADLYGEAATDFTAISRTITGQFAAGTIDGYTTLGARLGYTFDDDITLAVMGSDLSQARVANSYGLENERQVFMSLSKKF